MEAEAPQRLTRIPKEQKGPSRRSRLGSTLNYIVLSILAAAWLTPLAWAVDTALKPESETTITPITWDSSNFNLGAFKEVIDAGNILRWYGNSALVSIVVTAGVVILASLAAYALSRIPFRGRTVLFWVILAGLMIPPQVLILPLFAEMQIFGFVNTYQGIILPQLASALAVFILKVFFDGIPHELEESALVDGASRLRIYWQIWMPLARPALAAVAIFTFVTSWNYFIWPLVVVTSTNMMTIPLGLQAVQSAFGVHYAQIMASAVLGGLPLLVAFIFFQRQIVEGIANTGLKG